MTCETRLFNAAFTSWQFLIFSIFDFLILLLLLLLLLSILLSSRFMDLWKIICISFLCSCDKQSFSPSSILSFLFSSKYLLQFLKSSRSCVLLLPTPITSVICPLMASEEDNLLPSQLARYYLEASCSLLYGQELLHQLLSLTILHSPFSFCTTSKLSKYTRSNFLCPGL